MTAGAMIEKHGDISPDFVEFASLWAAPEQSTVDVDEHS